MNNTCSSWCLPFTNFPTNISSDVGRDETSMCARPSPRNEFLHSCYCPVILIFIKEQTLTPVQKRYYTKLSCWTAGAIWGLANLWEEQYRSTVAFFLLGHDSLRPAVAARGVRCVMTPLGFLSLLLSALSISLCTGFLRSMRECYRVFPNECNTRNLDVRSRKYCCYWGAVHGVVCSLTMRLCLSHLVVSGGFVFSITHQFR